MSPSQMRNIRQRYKRQMRQRQILPHLAGRLRVVQIQEIGPISYTGFPCPMMLKAGISSSVRCVVCGRTHTVYSSTKSDLKKQGEPVMLCEGCYNRTASRHVAGLVMLPTLDLFQMNRVSRDLGHCQVCNTFAIAWYDSSAQTGLCESCYARELSRLNQEGGLS